MKYGCIGERLSHSFSKEIHNMLADYEYELTGHNHVDSDDNDYCDSCGELMDAVLPWLPMFEI